MSIEGFKEDALSIPDPGLDQARISHFDFNGKPPTTAGFDANRQGDTAPSVLPGEQGSNAINFTRSENDFPHQTGSDSLTDEEAQLT